MARRLAALVNLAAAWGHPGSVTREAPVIWQGGGRLSTEVSSCSGPGSHGGLPCCSTGSSSGDLGVVVRMPESVEGLAVTWIQQRLQ